MNTSFFQCDTYSDDDHEEDPEEKLGKSQHDINRDCFPSRMQEEEKVDEKTLNPIDIPQLVSTHSQEVQEISQRLQALKCREPLLGDQQFADFSQLYDGELDANSRARRLLYMAAELRRLGEMILEGEREREKATEKEIRVDFPQKSEEERGSETKQLLSGEEKEIEIDDKFLESAIGETVLTTEKEIKDLSLETENQQEMGDLVLELRKDEEQGNESDHIRLHTEKETDDTDFLSEEDMATDELDFLDEESQSETSATVDETKQEEEEMDEMALAIEELFWELEQEEDEISLEKEREKKIDEIVLESQNETDTGDVFLESATEIETEDVIGEVLFEGETEMEKAMVDTVFEREEETKREMLPDGTTKEENEICDTTEPEEENKVLDALGDRETELEMEEEIGEMLLDEEAVNEMAIDDSIREREEETKPCEMFLERKTKEENEIFDTVLPRETEKQNEIGDVLRERETEIEMIGETHLDGVAIPETTIADSIPEGDQEETKLCERLAESYRIVEHEIGYSILRSETENEHEVGEVSLGRATEIDKEIGEILLEREVVSEKVTVDTVLEPEAETKLWEMVVESYIIEEHESVDSVLQSETQNHNEVDEVFLQRETEIKKKIGELDGEVATEKVTVEEVLEREAEMTDLCDMVLERKLEEEHEIVDRILEREIEREIEKKMDDMLLGGEAVTKRVTVAIVPRREEEATLCEMPPERKTKQQNEIDDTIHQREAEQQKEIAERVHNSERMKAIEPPEVKQYSNCEVNPSKDSSQRKRVPDPPCRTLYDPPGYEFRIGGANMNHDQEAKSNHEIEDLKTTFIDQNKGPFASFLRTSSETQPPPLLSSTASAEMQLPPHLLISDPPGEDPCTEPSILGYLGEFAPSATSAFARRSTGNIGGIEDSSLSCIGLGKQYELPNDEIPNTPVYFAINTSDGDATVEVVLAESFDEESFNFQREEGTPVLTNLSDYYGQLISSHSSCDFNTPAARRYEIEVSPNPTTDESFTSTTALSSSDSGFDPSKRVQEHHSSKFEQTIRRREQDSYESIRHNKETERQRSRAYERLQLRNEYLQSRGIRSSSQRIESGATSGTRPHGATSQGVLLSSDLRKLQLDKALADRVGAAPLRKERVSMERSNQHSRDSLSPARVQSPLHAPTKEQSQEVYRRSKPRDERYRRSNEQDEVYDQRSPKESSVERQKNSPLPPRGRRRDMPIVQGVIHVNIPAVPEAHNPRTKANRKADSPGPSHVKSKRR